MNEKIIGILGGMGPEATCEIFKRIIKFTGAKNDSEHLRVIIDNNPRIPDRTNAITNKGPNPINELVNTAHNVENAGADFIIVPCMTAHSFIDDIQEKVKIPILNGLELTKKYVYENHRDIKRFGLIATSGTISMGLFQKYLGESKIVIPRDALQDEVMDIIYGEDGIKAGNTSEDIITRINIVIDKMKEMDQIDGIIAGCTEIGLVLKQSDVSLTLIDPLTVLAKEAVKLGKS